MKFKVILGIILLLALAQFKRINKTNPPAVQANDFLHLTMAPQDIAALIQNGCYDCHGNTTEYPWYTNVAPLSWWIEGHIRNARKKINFSTWADYDSDQQRHNIEECIEVIEENRMPAKSFRFMHPEAKYTEAQKTAILDWLRTLKQ